MPRPENQNLLNPKQKYEKFKAAYSKLNEYIASGEYIAAHVIAFSILEDRVLANRLICEELSGEFIDVKINKNKIPFDKSIGKLLQMKVVDKNLHEQLSACGKERNEFIHQAMWRLDEFNHASILKIRKTINALEKCKRDYVKMYKK
jgi:hypothetical protein